MTPLQKLAEKIEARIKEMENGGIVRKIKTSQNRFELKWMLSEIRKIELGDFLEKEPDIYTTKDLKKSARR